MKQDPPGCKILVYCSKTIGPTPTKELAILYGKAMFYLLKGDYNPKPEEP